MDAPPSDTTKTHHARAVIFNDFAALILARSADLNPIAGAGTCQVPKFS
jgi:hypothetical protein